MKRSYHSKEDTTNRICINGQCTSAMSSLATNYSPNAQKFDMIQTFDIQNPHEARRKGKRTQPGEERDD